VAFRNLLGLPSISKNKESKQAKLYRDLLRHEAKIGGELFGPVPTGGRREFFCLDKHTWIWHEEWKDKSGNRQIRTTRYDVRDTGIVKVQDGKHYQKVTKAEAQKLLKAAKLYQKRVNNELYKAVLPE
jgi:hypothetical protein